jgi:hypothetical protein
MNEGYKILTKFIELRKMIAIIITMRLNYPFPRIVT